jgi:hypothetical protein
MTRILLAAAAVAALAGPALAAPARPNEMADTWLVQSHGRTLCHIRLSGRPGPNGIYGLRAPPECADVLPASVTGWSPTRQGLVLVSSSGAPTLSFRRWSESLYVTSGDGAPDVQLSRAVGSR